MLPRKRLSSTLPRSKKLRIYQDRAESQHVCLESLGFHILAASGPGCFWTFLSMLARRRPSSTPSSDLSHVGRTENQRKTENLPRSCRVTARLPRIARLHILVFNKILIYALRMVRLATLLAAWRRCPSPRNLDLDPLSCSKTVCLAIYPGDPANPSRASLGRRALLGAAWSPLGRLLAGRGRQGHPQPRIWEPP